MTPAVTGRNMRRPNMLIIPAAVFGFLMPPMLGILFSDAVRAMLAPAASGLLRETLLALSRGFLLFVALSSAVSARSRLFRDNLLEVRLASPEDDISRLLSQFGSVARTMSWSLLITLLPLWFSLALVAEASPLAMLLLLCSLVVFYLVTVLLGMLGALLASVLPRTGLLLLFLLTALAGAAYLCDSGKALGTSLLPDRVNALLASPLLHGPAVLLHAATLWTDSTLALLFGDTEDVARSLLWLLSILAAEAILLAVVYRAFFGRAYAASTTGASVRYRLRPRAAGPSRFYLALALRDKSALFQITLSYVFAAFVVGDTRALLLPKGPLAGALAARPLLVTIALVTSTAVALVGILARTTLRLAAEASLTRDVLQSAPGGTRVALGSILAVTACLTAPLLTLFGATALLARGPGMIGTVVLEMLLAFGTSLLAISYGARASERTRSDIAAERLSAPFAVTSLATTLLLMLPLLLARRLGAGDSLAMALSAALMAMFALGQLVRLSRQSTFSISSTWPS